MRKEGPQFLLTSLSLIAASCGLDRDPRAAPHVRVGELSAEDTARAMAVESQEACDAAYQEFRRPIASTEIALSVGKISEEEYNRRIDLFKSDLLTHCEGALTFPAFLADTLEPQGIEVNSFEVNVAQ